MDNEEKAENEEVGEECEKRLKVLWKEKSIQLQLKLKSILFLN
jgi:hypothetical protein